MELNEYIIAEILSLDCDNSCSLSNALSILMSKYKLKVGLLLNDDFVPYYCVSVNDILSINIDGEDLINIRNNGWELSSDKKNIIKLLNF